MSDQTLIPLICTQCGSNQVFPVEEAQRLFKIIGGLYYLKPNATYQCEHCGTRFSRDVGYKNANFQSGSVTIISSVNTGGAPIIGGPIVAGGNVYLGRGSDTDNGDEDYTGFVLSGDFRGAQLNIDGAYTICPQCDTEVQIPKGNDKTCSYCGSRLPVRLKVIRRRK